MVRLSAVLVSGASAWSISDVGNAVSNAASSAASSAGNAASAATSAVNDAAGAVDVNAAWNAVSNAAGSVDVNGLAQGALDNANAMGAGLTDLAGDLGNNAGDLLAKTADLGSEAARQAAKAAAEASMATAKAAEGAVSSAMTSLDSAKDQLSNLSVPEDVKNAAMAAVQAAKDVADKARAVRDATGSVALDGMTSALETLKAAGEAVGEKIGSNMAALAGHMDVFDLLQRDMTQILQSTEIIVQQNSNAAASEKTARGADIESDGDSAVPTAAVGVLAFLPIALMQ